MLESMRSHAQSWLAKFILGGIALSFALWGIGDYFMGSRIETVAEVDGTPIGDAEFVQAYKRQLNAYSRMLGKQFSKELAAQLGVKDETLQTIINRRLILDEAHNMGLIASESVLVASVQNDPAFRSGNAFDPQRYKALTRNMGFRTTSDFEAEQRLNLLTNTLQQSILRSATVSDEEVREAYALEYEKRVLEALIVDPADFEEGVKLSSDDAQAWYEAHSSDYMSPVRQKFEITVIDPAALKREMTISEADIRAVYDADIAKYSTPEQRKARHILVKVPPNIGEETKTKFRNKIEAAKSLLDKGEDFAKVAKDVSDDGSAEKGGDLGWFARGAMVPEFEDAVFAMGKGETSGIIETQFGYHIIRVDDIRPGKVKKFADVRKAIEKRLLDERVSKEAFDLSQDLDDALGREASLRAAAESLNLKVKEIGPVSRDEALAESLFTNKDLLDAAFKTLPGQAVEIQEIAGKFVAIEAIERIEPEAQPFAKVAKQVYEAATKARARELAQQEAEKLLTEASNASLSQLSQRSGQPLYTSKPVRNTGAGDSASWLSPAVLSEAFVLGKGGVLSKVAEVPQGLAIVRVKEIKAADESNFSNEADKIRAKLVQSKGAVRFARWMASVRDRHEITINNRILERL